MPIATDVCDCPMCAEAYREAHPEEVTQEIVRQAALSTDVWLTEIIPRIHIRSSQRCVRGAHGTRPYRNTRTAPSGIVLPNRYGRHTWGQIRDWLDTRTGITRCTHCFKIPDECECIECTCGHHITDSGDQCSECERCPDCCECRHCDYCEYTISNPGEAWCYDCDRCQECCSCNNTRIPFCDLSKKMHGKPSARYPRHVGVEIECGSSGNGYDDLKEALRRWGAGLHDDGSINLDHSMEIATAPAQGEALEEQIRDMCAALRECGGKVDASCGLHVHVSAKDLKPAQVLGAVRLYAKCETALYSIVSASRSEGSYSKMWGSSFEMGEVFEKGTVPERFDRLEATVYGSKGEAEAVKRAPHKHGSRYHGLNLNSLLLYGTIEFRLHQGTVSERKILMWAGVVSRLIQYAVEHSEKEIAKLGGTSWEVLCKVLRGDDDLVAWAKERREHFRAKIRYDRGLGAKPACRADAEASEV